jgi:1-acyl-sn-glycerol-3-phosphate acyltransferase
MQKPDEQHLLEGDGVKPHLPTAQFEKPRARKMRLELTALPLITRWRKLVRRFLPHPVRLLVRILTRCKVNGLQNFPHQGPALIVVNHLGDADAVLGLAFFPAPVDALAKMELYEFPLFGRIMHAYGVIWVHRGLPDRRAIKAVLKGLSEGRLIGIAPEGRESLTGGLEEGTGGAAYFALKTNVPIVPVTFTGTENNRIYPNLKKLRRTEVSITVGPVFQLEKLPDRRESIRIGTQKIMERLAKQLPPEYRGVYQVENE